MNLKDLRCSAVWLGVVACFVLAAGCSGGSALRQPFDGAQGDSVGSAQGDSVGSAQGDSVGSAQRSRASGGYDVLYSFGKHPGDGNGPFAGLVNVKGTLYGTTFVGGAKSEGTVFGVTTSGEERVVHGFQGSARDASYPEAGLIDVGGTLYGATLDGGAHNLGTVFAMTTSGKKRILHSFGRTGDGAVASADLLDVNGTLYGTTTEGGAHGAGTVFSISTSGKESVLYSFAGGSSDGANPKAGVTYLDGTLYGTTLEGGASSNGTVYAITPAGAETVLYSFAGGLDDGQEPYAGLIDVGGTLYGTTIGAGAHGAGIVFSITPSGEEKVVYSFAGSPQDGEEPYSSLLDVNGTLYGTTYAGGPEYGGTVYAVTTSGSETVLHDFAGSGDGFNPYAGLINVKGTLYGTTSFGGANSAGTVFSVTP